MCVEPTVEDFLTEINAKYNFPCIKEVFSDTDFVIGTVGFGKYTLEVSVPSTTPGKTKACLKRLEQEKFEAITLQPIRVEFTRTTILQQSL
jgi:hypothetical protein